MGAIFSIPSYPGAVKYNLAYSDPTSGDPHGVNRFGPWTPLISGGITSTSQIFDTAGDPRLRLYRVQPVVLAPDNATQVPLIWYDPFTVEEPLPGAYKQTLYDSAITALLPDFREYIGDYGTPQVSSSDVAMETGAGIGLLQFDGTRKSFNLADIPNATPVLVLEGTVTVVVGGLTLLNGDDFFVDYDSGIITFNVAPTGPGEIRYASVQYNNRMLNAALREAVNALNQVGINGYGTQKDRNVVLLKSILGDDGIKPIVFGMALKILSRAMLRMKSDNSRAYKINDISIDTAPARVVDAMSKQMEQDWSDLKDAANHYIRTATVPLVRTAYDSYFDARGTFPGYGVLYTAMYPAYTWYM